MEIEAEYPGAGGAPASPVSGTEISAVRNSAPGPMDSKAACTYHAPPKAGARPPAMYQVQSMLKASLVRITSAGAMPELSVRTAVNWPVSGAPTLMSTVGIVPFPSLLGDLAVSIMAGRT